MDKLGEAETAASLSHKRDKIKIGEVLMEDATEHKQDL